MLVLKGAISSVWSSLRNSFVALREQFLHKMGKFLDWLMNREKKDTSAGRPTINDPWLGSNRDSLLDMLASWWEEVGWQLPRVETRDQLRAALEPLREHPNRHLISRLLLASEDSATAGQIREKREVNGEAITLMYEAQTRERECMELIRQAQMALGQASPDEGKVVKEKLSNLHADLQISTTAYEIACKEQQAIEMKLDQMEAGFAQDELLMFVEKRFLKGRYARNPLNLADAMAGLPYSHGVHFMGVWQSYARCSKLPSLSHHHFQVFETVQSIWKKSQRSKLPTVEFFYQEITALPKTVIVKTIDPVTNKESKNKSENGTRSDLLKYWPLWSLAIKKSLESPVETERMPFVIGSNFTKVQRDPKTSVYLVLGDPGKSEN